jgi:hypothetical protein
MSATTVQDRSRNARPRRGGAALRKWLRWLRESRMEGRVAGRTCCDLAKFCGYEIAAQLFISAPPSPTTCERSSPSSASARATSLLPRFPHDEAQHRRSRRRLIPGADPRTAAAVPAWPAIKTLSTIGSRLSSLADAHRRVANIAWMSYLNRPCVVALDAQAGETRRR